MAEQLQAEFSLPVLKVRQSMEKRGPVAFCQLVVNTEGEQRVVASRSDLLADFGFVTRTDDSSELELAVPRQIVAWVADWVNDTLAPDAVLWLHLVKPYGQLGAVPWERDLQPGFPSRILRLPDVLPAPARSTSTFRLALCATAPAPEGPSTAAMMGPAIARAIADGIGPSLRLEVFGDLEAHEMLERDLANLGCPVEVHIPDAGFDQRYDDEATSQNRWLWWMRRVIAPGSVDAVHFVVHGALFGEEGAVLTPWSPTNEYRSTPQYVTARDLRQFLTAVGALTVGFSAPDDNYSDFGLRFLADDLGARRAGPVIFHDPQLDGIVLGDAYRFLASQEPDIPPRSPGLFIYAQPSRVGAGGGSADLDPRLTLESMPTSSAVKEHFAKEETPGWLAAAERYVDEQQAEVVRFEQSKSLRSPTQSQMDYYEGAKQGLAELRSLIDTHAEEAL